MRGHSYKLFARFVCNLLLDYDSCGSLARLTPFPDEMSKHGVVVPRTCAMLIKLASFDLDGEGEIDTETAELAELSSFFASRLYNGFVQRRAVARFKRAREATEDEATRSRLLDELSMSRVIDEELRTQVDIARCLFCTGIGEKERVAFALATPGAARLAAAWVPKKVLGSFKVFLDLKHTPQEFESFLVAVRRVTGLGLETEVKNPIVRQLLEYHGIARARGSGAEGFVGNLFREVSVVRFGQKLWLSSNNKDNEIGADTALPSGVEPSVIERLYKLTLKVVGKSTWDTDSHPCLSALKHARAALVEAVPPAAQGKEHQREREHSRSGVGWGAHAQEHGWLGHGGTRQHREQGCHGTSGRCQGCG